MTENEYIYAMNLARLQNIRSLLQGLLPTSLIHAKDLDAFRAWVASRERAHYAAVDITHK